LVLLQVGCLSMQQGVDLLLTVDDALPPPPPPPALPPVVAKEHDEEMSAAEVPLPPALPAARSVSPPISRIAAKALGGTKPVPAPSVLKALGERNRVGATVVSAAPPCLLNAARIG